MQDRVGEEFDGIVLSCTKYGFFVELEELFIEGLVPITSLGGFGARDYRDEDRYVFRDTDRVIVGQRSGRVFRMGMKVRVLLDRIDRQQRRLQFALLEVKGAQQVEIASGTGSLRRKKVRVAGEEAGKSPDRRGKPVEGEGEEATAEPEGEGQAAVGCLRVTTATRRRVKAMVRRKIRSALEAIPGGTIDLPAEVRLIGIRRGDTIVAWNEQEDGEQDGSGPDKGGDEQQVERGLQNAVEPELGQNSNQTEAIPEGHVAAERRGDGAGGREMVARSKPP